jgi:hypothetical protein
MVKKVRERTILVTSLLRGILNELLFLIFTRVYFSDVICTIFMYCTGTPVTVSISIRYRIYKDFHQSCRRCENSYITYRQEIEMLKRDLENAGRENTARATEVQQLRIELQRYISEVGEVARLGS